jgi:alkanesulfonate monooxygenase SsuD/methylene tetrahydromethanopterin reductase-like flavin-dependent oxidoreductase (luciferase family)
MKFGIFYELQCPRPWEADTEHKLYQNALSQVELADKLGYHYAWEVEHHFLEEYSHSPQPEVFLAAASQRTKNIRLGHGIIQLTTNHPARVAEKVACLDLVSNGRVEFGMGEGASITELGPFDRQMEDKQAVWEDGIRCVLPMFKDGGWEYDGPYFKFPLRSVLPKPIQKPHPPLWVACSQLETIELAGRCGIGALGFQFLSAEMAHAWVHAYYNSFVLRITFFQFSLAYYSNSRNRERAAPGTVSLWDEYEKWKKANPELAYKALTGGLVGSPETIRRKLRRFETSHVDQIILLNQAGKNSHEHICESLELFAREVMPEFVGHESEHQAWKQKVLSREIELEDIDTTPYKDRAGVGKGVAIDKLASAAE